MDKENLPCLTSPRFGPMLGPGGAKLSMILETTAPTAADYVDAAALPPSFGPTPMRDKDCKQDFPIAIEPSFFFFSHEGRYSSRV